MLRHALDLLHHSGIPAVARFLPNQHLLVLNIHRVRAEPSPFHDGVLELHPDQFREHLDWIGRHADFVPESALPNLRPGGRPKVLLTFDDGYLDAYDVIAPILEERKIPAIFFIAPALIDRRTLGAWDQIAYLVKEFRGPGFRFRGQDFSFANGARAVYSELSRISQMALPDRGQELVHELAATLKLAPPPLELQSAELMDWQQIRELQRRGFVIGCHGYSHRVLSSLAPREQEEDIALAKRRLAEEGFHPLSFAYPFGELGTFSWETRETALRAGFRFVFSFTGSAPRLKQIDLTQIDRVPFKSTVAKYDLVLTFPGIYNLIQWLRTNKDFT